MRGLRGSSGARPRVAESRWVGWRTTKPCEAQKSVAGPSAREALIASDADVSMVELARRAGVGSAILYRNFASRRELLEALYVDEIDAV